MAACGEAMHASPQAAAVPAPLAAYTDRMEFIEAVDLGSLFALGNFQQHTPRLVPVFKAVAQAGSLWALGAVAVLAFIGLTLGGRWRTSLLVFIAFLTTAIISQTVQPLVNRPRPDVTQVVSGRPSGQGFPNGEAAASSALLVLVLLTLVPSLRSRVLQAIVIVGGVVLVLAIGFSQMYLAWAYLSDVVGGWALGLSLALLFRWLDLRWNRPEPRAPAPA
jgi:membrane-associated phospholipid phosphatase